MCLKHFGNNKNCSKKEDLKMDLVLEDFKFVLKSQKSILQENLQAARIVPVDPVLHFAINSEMDQVFETLHWKNSNKFYFGYIPSPTYTVVDSLCDFSPFELHFESVSADNLNSLKQFLLNSPKIKFFHLTVRHFEGTEHFSSLWGAPYEFENSHNWFFRIKNSKILKISCRHGVVFSIWFTYIEVGTVPQGALIRG
ncbi:Protein CBG04669 [Caenorhabditis briggsae]|uniref:Protein CBG04669 n=1 Tax=Caenorhabditis briggsae TaxID=6238 RepID=A8WY70_CAEBR|nr:Protein CBG04669 [Caenorhabditis briggsae]CAP25328.2 Protein CBG04669 [Caenorhabditis briggsae]